MQNIRRRYHMEEKHFSPAQWSKWERLYQADHRMGYPLQSGRQLSGSGTESGDDTVKPVPSKAILEEQIKGSHESPEFEIEPLE